MNHNIDQFAKKLEIDDELVLDMMTNPVNAFEKHNIEVNEQAIIDAKESRKRAIDICRQVFTNELTTGPEVCQFCPF